MKIGSTAATVALFVSAVLIGVGAWLYVEVTGDDNVGQPPYSLSRVWAETMGEVVTNLLEESAGMSAHFVVTADIDLTSVAEKLSGLDDVNDIYVMGGCPSVPEFTCLVDVNGNNIVFKPQIATVSSWDRDNVLARATEVNNKLYGSNVVPNGITFFDWRYPEADRLLLVQETTTGRLIPNLASSYYCHSNYQQTENSMQIRVPAGITVLQVTVDVRRECSTNYSFSGGSIEISPDIEISIPSNAQPYQGITVSISPAVFGDRQIVDFDLTGKYIYYRVAILYRAIE